MPNMSRRSLEHHHDRVNLMAHNNPTKESYIRTRYQSKYVEQEHRSQKDYYYDSQDELDFPTLSQQRYSLTSNEYTAFTTTKTIISRIFSTIISLIYSTWYKMTNIFQTSERDIYHTRIEEDHGNYLKHVDRCKFKFNNFHNSVDIII